MYAAFLLVILSLIKPVIDLSEELANGSLSNKANYFQSVSNGNKTNRLIASELLFSSKSRGLERVQINGKVGFALTKGISESLPLLFSEFSITSCPEYTSPLLQFSQGSLRCLKTCNLRSLSLNSAFKENIFSSSLTISHNVKHLLSYGKTTLQYLQVNSKNLVIISGGDIEIENLSTQVNSKLWLISGTGRIKVSNLSSSGLINAASRVLVELPDNAINFSDPPPVRAGRVILSLSPIASPEDS